MTTPTDPASAAAATTLPANVGRVLDVVYQFHTGASTVAPPSYIKIVDGAVSVMISGTVDGDFAALVDSLRNLGMQINATDATILAVTGLLPIDQLPTASQIPQVRSITAGDSPFLR
ncbi:hypothetical protein [Paludisphaera mucosa]|uniref:Uncharacterized protein n=1 Tax=Paludisphaera mucosa TaxID=3030827 RepID=A0ABT6FAM8_9BACT|nr:hypothetical protein [Paludisphaera mucosa]MDG3004643.1 hypothetical protein [Paludisphaera mucosa]